MFPGFFFHFIVLFVKHIVLFVYIAGWLMIRWTLYFTLELIKSLAFCIIC